MSGFRLSLGEGLVWRQRTLLSLPRHPQFFRRTRVKDWVLPAAMERVRRKPTDADELGHVWTAHDRR
jgi:hypothetical protein